MQAAGGNEDKAAQLYLASGLLNVMLLALTNCFEVALRNKINEYMRETDPDWLIQLSATNSVLNKLNTIHTYNALKEVRERLSERNRLDNNQMVDGLSFGFWVSLFLPRQHSDIGDNLVFIFKIEHPRLLYIVQRNINQIRRLRNAIAHNAPVIFREGTSEVSFERIDLIVNRAIELTEWMEIDPAIYEQYLAQINQQKQAILDILG